jgi:predicted DNA-binding transcriptional regulator YafY
MISEKKFKVSSTAYRVLLLLLHLNSGKFTSENFNDVFMEDSYVSRYFSRDVILKYIITLRTAGYKITKPSPSNNYTYELEKSPILIELTDSQIKSIASMYWHAQCLHQSKIIDNYQTFLKKIQKFIPEKQVNLLVKELQKQEHVSIPKLYKDETSGELIKKIEGFMSENQRVSLKYKSPLDIDENHLILELKNIKYDNNEVYISGYSPITEQTQSVKLSQITEIKQLPIKSQYNHILSPVIFKLKGQLAKVYRPYENEKVSSESEKLNTLTVTSYSDDKDLLLKRLLKYGDSCEILYPKYFQKQMINTIETALQNYR